MTPPGYDLLEEIGRGGMGIVYRGRDQALGRVVAVKLLQGRYAPASLAARRFVDEAKITGQLQHPGIPPVHEVGHTPDGRPYLVMKLIKGQTLADIIADERQTPGALVAVFEQICQAVAYAHSHGVVHRDLKPTNVMVGAFGEVQVMDWGLAKLRVETRLGLLGPSFTSTLHDPRSGAEEVLHTQDGSFLGTPAYMSPEQAIGAVDLIDERSDVFGLGAVLCAILTGHPPFLAGTSETTRQMAAQKKLEPAFARLDACGAEPGLVALCRRCLAAEREERPRNAEDVAAAVHAIRIDMEGRARRAELERVKAEARAAEEAKTRQLLVEKANERLKRHRVQLALAGTVVFLLAGTSAGVWWNHTRSALRHAEAEAQAARAFNKADRLVELATALDPETPAKAEAAVGLWRQALAAAESAELAVASAGDPDLRASAGPRLAAIRDGLSKAEAAQARAQRDETLFQAIEKIRGGSADLGRHETDTRSADGYRLAFGAAGLPVGAAPDALAAAVRTERPGLRQAILPALDHWAWCLGRCDHGTRVRAAANLVDDDPFRKEVRDAIGRGDRSALLGLVVRPECDRLPPLTATLLGRALGDHNEHGAAARLLLAARDRNPGEYWVLMELAHALWELPKERIGRDEALACLRAALAVRPNSAVAHNRLGYALSQKGEREASERCYRRAVELDDSYAIAWHNLGLAAEHRGDPIGAEKALRKAIACDPQFSLALNALGFRLLADGKLDDAEDAFRKAIRFDTGNVIRAVAHTNLGVVLGRRGRIMPAKAEYQRAVDCDPRSALLHSNLGEAQLWVGDRVAAEQSFGKAIEVSPHYNGGHNNLAWLLFLRGDLSVAETHIRTALKNDPKDVGALRLLGWVLERKGDVSGAEKCLREATDLSPGGDAAHFFQLYRLKAHFSTPCELKQILADALGRNSKWPPQQVRAARSAAAVTAAWRARSDETNVSPEERKEFRKLARELFLDLLNDLSAGFARAPEEFCEEIVVMTSNWLYDTGLAHVRNLFRLATLDDKEAVAWTTFWATVRSLREKCLAE